MFIELRRENCELRRGFSILAEILGKGKRECEGRRTEERGRGMDDRVIMLVALTGS